MLRGFYTAAAGMMSQQRRTEMINNNIANANTPGFKADQASLRAFPEMLLQLVETKSNGGQNVTTSTSVGGLTTGVYMQEATPSFKQGDLRETGNNTDIALVDGVLPEGASLFFTVLNENGQARYTRNGNFTLDASGYLTTNEGYYVLDENHNQIQLSGDQFTVNSNGTIIENGIQVATMNISFAENANNLLKEGNGLLRAEDNQELALANQQENITYSLNQGFIERSNVDVAAAMTDMMTAYRSFEANQKVLQAYDRSMDKAANEIGRLR